MPVLGPLTPKTPSTLLANLVLSPTLPSTIMTSIPAFAFSPPTPTPAHPPPQAIQIHRNLAPNEARQLTLLLTQHLFPVRHSPKGLMQESIALAERLHEAGLRWDHHRRVMGMHLRGIWEEGQRLGSGRVMGCHGPMDLYVQGSFLTIAEEPHPLDTMPIPIEVHHASFAALPKLTLQAGLANAMPGASTFCDDPPLATASPTTDRGSKIQKRDKIKKRLDLRIRTDSTLQSRSRLIRTPWTAAGGFGVGKWPRLRLKVGRSKLRRDVKVGGEVQTARKVSFGGWEVR